jgi:hypothetical protein
MQSIYEQFKARRTRQIILAILILPILAGLIYLEIGGHEEILGIDADSWSIWSFGIIVLALGYSMYNWRCPSCKKYMGRNINPKNCPRCKISLEEEI